MLREKLNEWSEATFEEALQEVEFDKKIKDIFVSTDFFKEIKNRKIDSNSVTEISGINERDRGQFRFRMSDVFHNAIQDDPENGPMLYLLRSTEKLSEEKQNKQEISANLGRIYRSFASFIRDLDSKETLSNILNKTKDNLNIEIWQDSELDAKYHADLVLRCSQDEITQYFWIWLYQATEKGKDKVLKRIGGGRGSLPTGIHVLVPLRTEVIEVVRNLDDRYRRNGRFLEKRTEELFAKENKRMEDMERNNRSKIKESTIRKLKAQCDKYQQELDKIKTLIRNLEQYSENIIDIHSWLLYSEKYLEQVATKCFHYIRNNTKPKTDYATLQQKFQYPQEVVSSLFFFNKLIDKEKAKLHIKQTINMENCIPFDKLAKGIGCHKEVILSLIKKLSKEKKIEGSFQKEEKYILKSDIEKGIQVISDSMDKL